MPITYNTAKSEVISLLQASRAAYATTTDGTKRQFSSNDEINNAILYADSEVCNDIINTIGHPFQNGFVATSSALSNGATIPSHTGMILKVLCLNGQATVTLTGVDHTNDIYTVSGGHGLAQGQKVQVASTVSLPTGLSAATDYWVIYVSTTTFKLASNPFYAAQSTAVAIFENGSGTITVAPQYVEGNQAVTADEVKEIWSYGNIYKHDNTTNNNLLNFWFIEGNILYISCLYGKVVYTTYTLGSSPQAPEEYLPTVVAGAVSMLLKDGGDEGLAGYYRQIYDRGREMIRAGQRAVPMITAYQMQSA